MGFEANGVPGAGTPGGGDLTGTLIAGRIPVANGVKSLTSSNSTYIGGVLTMQAVSGIAKFTIDTSNISSLDGATVNIRTSSSHINILSNQSIYLSSADITNGRVPFIGALGLLQTGATTSTELGYLNGVTSPIQTQLNGKVSGSLTVDNFPIATGSNTIGPSDAIYKSGSSLFVSRTAAYLQVNDLFAQIRYGSTIASYAIVNSSVATIGYSDIGGVGGSLQISTANVLLSHDTQINFTSPSVTLQQLTANTLPYLDSLKTLRSSNTWSNGQFLSVVSGVPTWVAAPSGGTTYTAGNGISLLSNIISLTSLTTAWDTGKNVIIGDDYTAINITTPNDGININSLGYGVSISSNSIGLRANGIMLSALFENTIRIADGTESNGYVLTSDSTGRASWKPSSGGGSGTVTSITAGTGLSGGTITISGTIAIANTTVTAGSYTNANITVNAQGQITAASNGTGGGSSYTFSTGLTNTSGTVTANLATGLAGGQSVIGGTAAGENLTIVSTGNSTKGKILFGTSGYDEVNNRLGITTAIPSYTISFAGNAQATIGINRQFTASTVGQDLTIRAGTAANGGTNLAGGFLNFIPGTSTGSALSGIRFYGSGGGASGTSDVSPALIATMSGIGDWTFNGDLSYTISTNTMRILKSANGAVGYTATNLSSAASSQARFYSAAGSGSVEMGSTSTGYSGSLPADTSYLDGSGNNGLFVNHNNNIKIALGYTEIARFQGGGFIIGAATSPDSACLIDMQSTTKGLRIPRGTTAQRTAISTTSKPGIIFYDTDLDKLYCTNNAGVWVPQT